MKIIIVGGGKIGKTLIADLLAEDHDITLVDPDPEVINDITNLYDVMCVCGSGTDCGTLAEADVEHTDLFISVSGSDELNMLSCFFARRMGAKHTIARLRDTEYSSKSLTFMRQQLDLSMTVNPELMAAAEIHNILKFPGAAKIEYFNRRNFEMVEEVLRKDSPLCGSLPELRKKYDAKFLVSVVQRGDNVVIPDGSFVLQEGDRVCIAATPTEINKLMRQMKLFQRQARNVMIVGGSRIGFFLSKLLLDSGSSVTIIDNDPARAQQLSETLPGARVICADGAKQEVLTEEGITTMDAFISLTGIDEENILLTYYAQSIGIKKVVAKVNRSEFYPLAAKLGIECLVSSKNTVSGLITRYARALQNSIGSNVETLYRLFEGRAEAVEFIVGQDFSMTNIPLKDLPIKAGMLIVGIIRGKRPMIPTGVDVILPGDSVIVTSAGQMLKSLSDILQ